MKATSSPEILKIIYRNGSYLLLFEKQNLQSFLESSSYLISKSNFDRGGLL